MREIPQLPGPLKPLIPQQLKLAARSVLFAYIFRQAMRDLTRLRPGEMPSRELLKKLRLGWNNQGWDAKLDYLEEIAERAVATEGPILECGSGLTTLVLGYLAGKRKVRTWSLEHNAGWHRRVSNAIERYRVPEVNLCFAPLRDYEKFNWYDPPLADMPATFRLVICDGPPDLASGGRYGLLPIFWNRLEPGAVVLFDDAREPGQPDVLQRWTSERGVSVELRETEEVSFALVHVP